MVDGAPLQPASLRVFRAGSPGADALLRRVPLEEIVPDADVSARTAAVFGAEMYAGGVRGAGLAGGAGQGRRRPARDHSTPGRGGPRGLRDQPGGGRPRLRRRSPLPGRRPAPGGGAGGRLPPPAAAPQLDRLPGGHGADGAPPGAGRPLRPGGAGRVPLHDHHVRRRRPRGRGGGGRPLHPSRSGTGASARRCWSRPTWPGCSGSSRWAGPRPSWPWPTGRSPSPGWTRCWARATSSSSWPSGASSAPWPSTSSPAPRRPSSWRTSRPIRKRWPPTCWPRRSTTPWPPRSC